MKLSKNNVSCFRLVPLLAALIPLAMFSLAHSAEFSFHPSISVSEEFTDNVYESREDKRYDFVTHLSPGIDIASNSPFWNWGLSYVYDYRYYARNSRTDDNAHNLNVTGLTKVIKDLLIFEVSDVYSRVPLDVSRDRAREGLFVDLSDSNIFTASPYFNFKPGPQTTIKTGYRYRNVWYNDPAAIDKRQHIGFAEATYEYSPKLNFTANYTYTHENSNNAYDRHAPFVGFRYEYKDRSFFFAQGGYTWFSTKYQGNFSDPFWSGGLTHVMGKYTVSLTTGVTYPDDPESSFTKETDYGLSVTKELSRGSVGLSVSYAKFSAGAIVDTDSRYGAGMIASYNLGTRLVASLSANVDKYNYRTPNTYTRRIYVSPAVTYQLPKEISITLSYIYDDYYSPLRFDDNYTINRVILGAKKIF